MLRFEPLCVVRLLVGITGGSLEPHRDVDVNPPARGAAPHPAAMPQVGDALAVAEVVDLGWLLRLFALAVVGRAVLVPGLSNVVPFPLWQNR